MARTLARGWHGLAGVAARWLDRVRYRLRYRLAMTLVFASLVPMVFIAVIGATVVLRSLERAQLRNIQGQLDVAFNLLGGRLERLGIDAERIASGAGAGTLDSPYELRALMVGLVDELPAALIEFYNDSGALVYREILGGEAARFTNLQSPMLPQIQANAADEYWRRRVTLISYGSTVVVQATAPIIDVNRRTAGLVVLSFPLDEIYLNSVKTLIGTELMLINTPDVAHLGLPRLRSTFPPDATPAPNSPTPASVPELARGARIISIQTVNDKQFHMAWRAVFNHANAMVGFLGVAVDRTPLVEAQGLAFRSLAIAAALALVLAFALATWLSQRLEKPIVRLRDSALAVARGDMTVALKTDDRGEIGDLARAFAQMTASVRDASFLQEQRVKERTQELSHANAELAQAFADLHQAQTQLVHSERMAGLGLLVAGVAHEINSPTAAIRGAADALSEIIGHLGDVATALLVEGYGTEQREAVFAWIAATARHAGEQSTPSGVSARRLARALSQTHSARLLGLNIDSSELARIGIENHHLDNLVKLTGDQPVLLASALRALVAYTRALRSTRIIHQAIGRVMRIVSALKTYSHFDQSTPVGPDGQVDLHAGIESTLMLFDFALRGITVERSFAPDMPLIIGMADELNQIWTNLVQNAIHALAGHGTLHIATQHDGNMVRVTVTDSGTGIPPEVLPRIFEPFYTTKPKGQGTGLGLGIVRNIVERHRGTINCQSQPGRTMFIVSLPIVADQV